MRSAHNNKGWNEHHGSTERVTALSFLFLFAVHAVFRGRAPYNSHEGAHNAQRSRPAAVYKKKEKDGGRRKFKQSILETVFVVENQH